MRSSPGDALTSAEGVTLAEGGGCSLQAQREGARLELSVAVQVAGGAGSYGRLELDAQALRRLIGGLRRELWAIERAEGLGAAGGQ